MANSSSSSSWSPENATKAYLGALRMGKRGREPDVSEFISALAAGNNAQLMVEICSTEKPTTGATRHTTTLALVAAAQQTGGRVVCILPTSDDEELKESIKLLGPHSGRVELVSGDPQTLLLEKYRQADFILFDCHANCLRDLAQRVAAQSSGGRKGPLLVGYNALDKAPWTGNGRAGGVLSKGLHYLPIGSGLVVGKAGDGGEGKSSSSVAASGRSKWVVRVDKCTGEEHVFRIVSPHQHKTVVQA